MAADPPTAEIEYFRRCSISLLLHPDFILQMGHVCDNEMHVRDKDIRPNIKTRCVPRAVLHLPAYLSTLRLVLCLHQILSYPNTNTNNSLKVKLAPAVAFRCDAGVRSPETGLIISSVMWFIVYQRFIDL